MRVCLTGDHITGLIHAEPVSTTQLYYLQPRVSLWEDICLYKYFPSDPALCIIAKNLGLSQASVADKWTNKT